MERRDFLTLTGASALGVVATTSALSAPAAQAATVPAADTATPTFLHGVASGDPLPDAVVLWTRVTPTPEATPGSGTGPRVNVRWEVATDASFSTIVRKGTIATGPERDHTVKLDVTGLSPATDYHYRFVVGGVTSPIGRTRTAPAAKQSVDRLRFGVVSCSNWEAGYFSAYRHLAARGDLDAVLHMGDYIYEYAAGGYTGPKGAIRQHEPVNETITLADYRQRHALHKTDPDLQALHAQVPWITTWDDHETANDAWIGGAENHTEGTEGSWEERKAAARAAYDEWMPVRLSGTAVQGDGTQIYRHLQFGTLADLTMLDLRSYRSQQVGAKLGMADDTDRTITGAEQMQFLKDRLAENDATWKLVGNPVMIAPVLLPPLDQKVVGPIAEMIGLPKEGLPYNVDQWDGYQADRRELVDFIDNHGIKNTVFLTGDIHSSWACEIPVDAGAYPFSRNAGVELVATSVTSSNLDDILKVAPRTLSIAVEGAIMTANWHIKAINFDDHGHSVLTVTPSQARMDWYTISDKTKKDATCRWMMGWTVPVGTNKLRRAWTEGK